jgi:hypothetical protein
MKTHSDAITAYTELFNSRVYPAGYPAETAGAPNPFRAGERRALNPGAGPASQLRIELAAT